MNLHVTAFDLDDTLGPSFGNVDNAILNKLKVLRQKYTVAIISGRHFEGILSSGIAALSKSVATNDLYVFPESGSLGYKWENNAWTELYSQFLSELEHQQIEQSMLQSLLETGLNTLPTYGNKIVHKHAMVACAMLGIGVPADIRNSWDPHNTKRATFVDSLRIKLPRYDIVFGGATSVDVTKRDVNKTVAINWLLRNLSIAPNQILFVGDSIYPGGNDYCVLNTKVSTRQTTSVDMTSQIIDELLCAR